MTSIVRRLCGAAIVAFVAMPALAQSPARPPARSPAYVGTWAAEPAQCRVGQEEENAPMARCRWQQSVAPPDLAQLVVPFAMACGTSS
jgi:hypothetical protein